MRRTGGKFSEIVMHDQRFAPKSLLVWAGRMGGEGSLEPGGGWKWARPLPIAVGHFSLTGDRESNRYPYPLFEMLSPAWRGAVFAGSALLMTISSLLLRFVYRRANGDGIPPPSRPGAIKSQ